MKEPTELILRFSMNKSVHPENLINDKDFFPIEKSSVPQITDNQFIRTVENNVSQLEIIIQLNRESYGSDQLNGVVLKLSSGHEYDLLEFAIRLSFVYPLICEDTTIEKIKCDQELFTVIMDRALINQTDEIIHWQNMFLLNSEDPETLHQLRIRLRQMRSYFWCLGSLMNKSEVDRWRKQLKEITDLTAQVRELDVLLNQCTDFCSSQLDDEYNFTKLTSELTGKRELASGKVKTQLLTGSFTPILLTLRLGLMLNHWESDDPMMMKMKVTMTLRKHYDRLQSSLKKLDSDKISELHQLRIETKKIHYSLLLIEPLMTKKIRPVIKDLKLLQDQLGHYCDLSKNRSLLSEIHTTSTDRSIADECGRMEGYLASEMQLFLKKSNKIKLHKSLKKQWL